MSYDLYYRGSSSYEDAVRHAIEPVSRAARQGLENIGDSISDLNNNFQQASSAINELRDTYIAGTNAQLAMQAQNANALYANAYATHAMSADIQSGLQSNIYAIQNMSTGITNTLRESTLTLVASDLMLKQTFTHGFNEVTKTIDLGFGSMGNKLDIISERLEVQNEQLEKLIYNTENPSLKASRELYRRALLGCRTECFKEAVENCNAAVEKNNMDYESYYLLGFIHLFGVSEDDNMVDIDKAVEALKTASKLSKSNPDCSAELKSQINYYLGYARLIKSNNLLIENKQEESIQLLNEALTASTQASEWNENNLDAQYEQIKELHFLSRDSEALTLLEKLIRKEKHYALKALQDKNLESLWPKIEKIVENLRNEQAEWLLKRCRQQQSTWNEEIEQRQNRLTEIKFPPEEQTASYENFYKNELIKAGFSDDSGFAENVYDDFNSLAEQIHSPFVMTKHAFQKIAESDSIIQNVRAGTSGISSILKKLSEDMQKTFGPYEEAAKKDYFTVREMAESYLESDNQNRLNSIHGSILNSLSECDKTTADLENDTDNLKSYIEAQKQWPQKQEELNSKRRKEVTDACTNLCSKWTQKAKELEQETLSLNISNRSTYEAILGELKHLKERCQQILNYYDSIKSENYFDVLKKYRKFKKSPFYSSSSYFEYTLKVLGSKIEDLKNPLFPGTKKISELFVLTEVDED